MARSFVKVLPITATQLLVQYEENGVKKNFHLDDPALASQYWGLHSQIAVAESARVKAIGSAQAAQREEVDVIESDYRQKLQASQAKYTTASEVAEQARRAADDQMAPAKEALDTQAFQAALKALPPEA